MSIYTKETKVTGPVSVWAVPNRYGEPGEEPFTYEIRTTSPWGSGSVEVNAYSITLVVPAGLNLIAKAIKTIEAAKKEASDEYLAKLRELDQRIDELKLLGGPVAGGSPEEVADDILEGTFEEGGAAGRLEDDGPL